MYGLITYIASRSESQVQTCLPTNGNDFEECTSEIEICFDYHGKFTLLEIVHQCRGGIHTNKCYMSCQKGEGELDIINELIINI